MVAFPAYQPVINQLYEYQLKRQPNRSTPFLNTIQKKEKKGQNIALTVSFGAGMGSSRAEGAAYGAPQTETKVPTSLPWKIYGDSFEITNLLEDALDGSNQQISDVFGEELFDCSQRLAKRLGNDALVGDGTGTNMLGLLAAAGGFRSAGTYAGINRATYSQWAGNEVNVAGAVTYAGIRSIMRATYDADGAKPDLIFTPSSQEEKIGLLPEFKDVNRVIRPDTNQGNRFVMGAGYSGLTFDGKPIVMDQHVPADMVVGVSYKHSYIAVLPPAQARRERGEIIAMVPLAGSDEDQLFGNKGGSGLFACLYKMGRIGSKTQFDLEITCNVVCERPKSNFLMRGLT